MSRSIGLYSMQVPIERNDGEVHNLSFPEHLVDYRHHPQMLPLAIIKEQVNVHQVPDPPQLVMLTHRLTPSVTTKGRVRDSILQTIHLNKEVTEMLVIPSSHCQPADSDKF